MIKTRVFATCNRLLVEFNRPFMVLLSSWLNMIAIMIVKEMERYLEVCGDRFESKWKTEKSHFLCGEVKRSVEILVHEPFWTKNSNLLHFFAMFKDKLIGDKITGIEYWYACFFEKSIRGAKACHELFVFMHYLYLCNYFFEKYPWIVCTIFVNIPVFESKKSIYGTGLLCVIEIETDISIGTFPLKYMLKCKLTINNVQFSSDLC